MELTFNWERQKTLRYISNIYVDLPRRQKVQNWGKVRKYIGGGVTFKIN